MRRTRGRRADDDDDTPMHGHDNSSGASGKRKEPENQLEASSAASSKRQKGAQGGRIDLPPPALPVVERERDDVLHVLAARFASASGNALGDEDEDVDDDNAGHDEEGGDSDADDLAMSDVSGDDDGNLIESTNKIIKMVLDKQKSLMQNLKRCVGFFQTLPDDLKASADHLKRTKMALGMIGARGTGKTFAVNQILSPNDKGTLPLPASSSSHGGTQTVFVVECKPASQEFTVETLRVSTTTPSEDTSSSAAAAAPDGDSQSTSQVHSETVASVPSTQADWAKALNKTLTSLNRQAGDAAKKPGSDPIIIRLSGPFSHGMEDLVLVDCPSWDSQTAAPSMRLLQTPGVLPESCSLVMALCTKRMASGDEVVPVVERMLRYWPNERLPMLVNAVNSQGTDPAADEQSEQVRSGLKELSSAIVKAFEQSAMSSLPLAEQRALQDRVLQVASDVLLFYKDHDTEGQRLRAFVNQLRARVQRDLLRRHRQVLDALLSAVKFTKAKQSTRTRFNVRPEADKIRQRIIKSWEESKQTITSRLREQLVETVRSWTAGGGRHASANIQQLADILAATTRSQTVHLMDMAFRASEVTKASAFHAKTHKAAGTRLTEMQRYARQLISYWMKPRRAEAAESLGNIVRRSVLAKQADVQQLASVIPSASASASAQGSQLPQAAETRANELVEGLIGGLEEPFKEATWSMCDDSATHVERLRPVLYSELQVKLESTAEAMMRRLDRLQSNLDRSAVAVPQHVPTLYEASNRPVPDVSSLMQESVYSNRPKNNDADGSSSAPAEELPRVRTLVPKTALTTGTEVSGGAGTSRGVGKVAVNISTPDKGKPVVTFSVANAVKTKIEQFSERFLQSRHPSEAPTVLAPLVYCCYPHESPDSIVELALPVLSSPFVTEGDKDERRLADHLWFFWCRADHSGRVISHIKKKMNLDLSRVILITTPEQVRDMRPFLLDIINSFMAEFRFGYWWLLPISLDHVSEYRRDALDTRPCSLSFALSRCQTVLNTLEANAAEASRQNVTANVDLCNKLMMTLNTHPTLRDACMSPFLDMMRQQEAGIADGAKILSLVRNLRQVADAEDVPELVDLLESLCRPLLRWLRVCLMYMEDEGAALYAHLGQQNVPSADVKIVQRPTLYSLSPVLFNTAACQYVHFSKGRSKELKTRLDKALKGVQDEPDNNPAASAATKAAATAAANALASAGLTVNLGMGLGMLSGAPTTTTSLPGSTNLAPPPPGQSSAAPATPSTPARSKPARNSASKSPSINGPWKSQDEMLCSMVAQYGKKLHMAHFSGSTPFSTAFVLLQSLAFWFVAQHEEEDDDDDDTGNNAMADQEASEAF